MAGQGRSGGVKGFLTSGVILVVLIAVVIGWARVNNVTDLTSAYNYFKSVSDKAWECGAGEAEWNCGIDGAVSADGGGSEPGSNQGSSDGSSDGATSGDQGGSAGDTANEQPAPARSDLEAQLDSITVADSQEVKYDRSEWKHWIGSPCNTRQAIVIETGTDLAREGECKVTSGKWFDVYAGLEFTDASKMDVDHIVPLSYAAKNGGNEMSGEEKTAFANDREGLLLVDAGENRSKGDSGPSEYLPPRTEFRCEYIGKFLHMVKKYDLTMPASDVTKSRAVILSDC